MAGLKNKEDQPEFFNFVKGYDLFFLYETFIEDKDFFRFEKYFSGYKLSWIGAKRDNKFGRAKQGCLYGIRINCEISKLFDFIILDGFSAVRFKIDTEETYILPAYISGDKWNDEFERLANFLHKISVNVILLGDFNVRVADLQSIPADLVDGRLGLSVDRKSKDIVINNKGKMFVGMCDECNLIILNGRTPSDPDGEFTFIGGPGNSVNDLCCVSYDLAGLVSDFCVVPQLFSDHMPLHLSLSLNTDFRKNTLLPLLPKLTWTVSDDKHFGNKLQKIVNCNKNISLNTQEAKDVFIKMMEND